MRSAVNGSFAPGAAVARSGTITARAAAATRRRMEASGVRGGGRIPQRRPVGSPRPRGTPRRSPEVGELLPRPAELRVPLRLTRDAQRRIRHEGEPLRGDLLLAR